MALRINGWTTNYYMTDKDVALYTDLILDALTQACTRDDGATEFMGCPLSRLVSHLRDRQCKIPGKIYDQRSLFEALGFVIVTARPKWGFRDNYQRSCDVVTL